MNTSTYLREKQATAMERLLADKEWEVAGDELCVENEALDMALWKDALMQHPCIKGEFPTHADAVKGGDLFSALFRSRPAMREGCVKSAWSKVVEAFLKTEGFQRLHAATMIDDELAMAASVTAKREADENAAVKKEKQAEQQREVSKRHREKAAGKRRRAKQQKKDGDSEGAEQSEQEAASYEGDAEASDATAKKLQEQSEAMAEGEGFADSTAKRMAMASQHITDTAQALLNNGFVDDDKDAVKLALNSEFKDEISRTGINRIMEIAGRMQAVTNAMKSLKPAPHPDRVDIVCGNDINAILPSELMMAADESTEAIFDRRYTEGSLLQYKRETTKLGRGGLVVCVDETGSMMGCTIQFAKAICMVMRKKAMAERRKFHGIAFGQHHISKEVHNVLPTQPTPEEWIGWLEHFFAGSDASGSYMFPIEEALEVVKTKQQDADIIIITDGNEGLRPKAIEKFKKAQKEIGVRLIVIGIGCRFDPRQFKDWADKLLHLQTLSDGVVNFIEDSTERKS